MLVEQSAELLSQRIGDLFTYHFEADRERMAGAHGARQKIERVGQLRFQFVEALPAFFVDTQQKAEWRQCIPPPWRARWQTGRRHGSNSAARRPATNATPEVIMNRCTVQSRPGFAEQVRSALVEALEPSALRDFFSRSFGSISRLTCRSSPIVGHGAQHRNQLAPAPRFIKAQTRSRWRRAAARR